MEYEILTKENMPTKEREIKTLLREYYANNKDCFDENSFYDLIKDSDNIFIVFAHKRALPLGLAVCETSLCPKTSEKKCTIWIIYSSLYNEGEKILKVVEDYVRDKDINKLLFWSNKPLAFEKLCKIKNTGFNLSVAIFEKEIEKEEVPCHN